jgi:hypothetical protein
MPDALDGSFCIDSIYDHNDPMSENVIVFKVLIVTGENKIFCSEHDFVASGDLVTDFGKINMTGVLIAENKLSV